MNTDKRKPETNSNVFCPYCGIVDDATTSLGYPSLWNYCHRANPVEVANLEHQRIFCLTAEHSNCPVFLREGSFPLPVELRGRSNESRRGKKSPWKVVVILAVGLLVLLIGWQFLTNGRLLPALPGAETAVSPTLSALPAGGTRSPSITPSPTATPLETPTALPLPSPSATPSQTPLPRYELSAEMPIGLNKQFMIHEVQPGESLELFANKYGTTVEVIKAVNFYLHSPLLEKTMLVIPLDMTTAEGLPAFEPYMVAQDSITIEALAQELSVNADLLIRYNDLVPAYLLRPGDWLLIPRTNPNPD